jgi:RNA polymerase sigma factor (sigma-70 family)
MKKADLSLRSDEELMEMYKVGNQLAFEILFERYSARVLGFLTGKLRSRNQAQDLLQESFIKLHRFKEKYDRSFPFAPWLFSIARTTWLDYLKKEKLDQQTLQTHGEINLEIPVSNTSADNSSEMLTTLPAAQRSAVSLRIYDEATFEEIALKLSTTPENARQLFSRGIKRLKETWNKKD